MSDISVHDQRSRYCPKLGHEIAFSYCRTPGGEVPCSRIHDCWWQQLDIAAFLSAHYDEQTRSRIATPPPDRMSSLFDLMRQAQQRVAKNDGDSAK